MCHVGAPESGQTPVSATAAHYYAVMRLCLIGYLVEAELLSSSEYTKNLPGGAFRLLLDHGSRLLERSLKSTREAS